MARGAPDHTRLSDDAHSRYTWRWQLGATVNQVSGITYTPIDEAFEGVLISFSAVTYFKSTRFRIYVDDVLIQEMRPEILFELMRFRHPDSGHDIMGVNKYDDVNKIYALWWQSHFKCYVKKSVKIETWQGSGGNIWVSYPQINYLERI